MQTQEEQQELIVKSAKSITQATEVTRRLERANRKAADASARAGDKMSVFAKEMGHDHLTVEDVFEHLESQGRNKELVEFIDALLVIVNTGREADAVNKEAASAYARANTLLVDLINRGIMDGNNERVAAVLEGLRKNDQARREHEKRAVRLTPGREQPLRDWRGKLTDRGI